MSVKGYLEENGCRALGYFNGIHAFLGQFFLITIEPYWAGYVMTIDSTVKNIGMVYYVENDEQAIDALNEVVPDGEF